MHQRRSTRRRALAALAVALFLLLGACTGDDGGDNQPTAAAGSSDAKDLRGVCPDPIVIQTSWDPSAESFGALYALLGPNPQEDAKRKRVTAPLVAQGKDTGVKLELRAGGPATGFEKSTATMFGSMRRSDSQR